MASPPWAGAASHEQFFVLLTGANSGVGLGTGQRIIDEFLASRSLSSHLILIPTTRSVSKSRDTILSLRAHLKKTAKTSQQLRSRAGHDYDPQTAISRVHILSIQVDLCDLRSIYGAAKQLVHGTVSDPTGLVKDVKIPRLDVALFNAGIGGWSGLDWILFAKQFLQVGLVQCCTFPVFKKALPAATLDQKKLLGDSAANLKTPPPELAEVFCANVFGHYILAHELLPLLSTAVQAPIRSKRITDLLCLTEDLPTVQKVSSPYFSSPATADKPIKPRFYLFHPGVVCTPLFPLSWLLYWAYYAAMYLARWFGSPWHPVEPYLGACASTWLALADQDSLDELNAERVKWGTCATRSGRVMPKKAEVDGWGWEGVIENARRLNATLLPGPCTSFGAVGGTPRT
ncbi:3-keto-steroid reductase [Daldinia childiae]|uniref:3-keto-steroid reductase n=1 Tax=Daldinia childiae TaxID=326645 RepID=UPI00144705F3|nr:3-keto-steroid reductase [Daldinia childiae]KAF3061783.1 3-keto-steroid reductase [Daldinia childiae]